MSLLATWFIFEFKEAGTASDVSERQAFKNVSLQTMIDQNSLQVVYLK